MKKNLLLLILIIIGFQSFAQVTVTKSTVVKEISGIKYYIHTVSTGETVYSICKAYNVDQRDLNKSNSNFSAKLETGQQIKIPFNTKGSENEAAFYWHKVLPKQTVYAISKQYNISVDDIYKHNPNAKNEIHAGEILKIPNSKKGGIDFSDDNYIYYTVEPGNTLFSITQMYGVSISQIYNANPETKEGLKTGQVLKIPKINYSKDERLPVENNYTPNLSEYTYDPNYFEDKNIPCTEFKYKPGESFNIAIMLPLFLEQNRNISSTNNAGKSLMFKNSEMFLEMYQGMLIALYQLKTAGISLNLTVYDTENSSSKVQQILKEPELKNSDLIIGPVYSANVTLAGKFAKDNKINLVSPLSQNQQLLENNPFLFQVMPSKDIRIKKTSDFFSKLYDSSIVFIHGGTPDELNIINSYKQKLVRSFASNESIQYINIKSINYNEGGIAKVEDALSLGLENIIVITSEEEGFTTKVIDKLNNISNKYDIKLIGSPNWESFQSINMDYLQNMGFEYISPTFIDYENWRTKSFITKYRNAYNAEPGIYAYEGYDIMYFFVNAMRQYGKNFQFCMSPTDNIPGKNGIVFDFDFVRTGTFNGFQNNGTHALKYDKQYRLEKIKYY
jgi:LysM repeat protein/ABC-type branched-subunit amino acid transport system substrate-binding protein